MTEDVVKTALLEVVRKITIESGDILVVRILVPEEDLLGQFRDVLVQCNPGKKIFVVDESQIEIVRDLNEDEMRELGWVRETRSETRLIPDRVVEALKRGEKLTIRTDHFSGKLENVIYEPLEEEE